MLTLARLLLESMASRSHGFAADGFRDLKCGGFGFRSLALGIKTLFSGSSLQACGDAFHVEFMRAPEQCI